MQFMLVTLALLSGASASKEHPIAGLIAKLEELKVQAREEGDKEAVMNQKFEYWCKNTIKQTSTDIANEKDAIATMEDKIDSKTKLIASLTEEIAKLSKQLEQLEVSQTKSDEIREEQNSAFEDANKDFKSTIESIQMCIDELEGSKGAEGLLLSQKSVKKVLDLAETLVSDQERVVLTSFLQQPSKPDAKVYSFKSQGVIELLKKLKEKFETDKLETTKAETNSLNAYNLAKDENEQVTKAANKAKKEKSDFKATAESDLTQLEEDLAQTKEDLAANEKLLEETTSECTMKADEFAQRSATRANELVAMDMAIKILAKAAGIRAPKSEELVQATSFIQIDDPKAKAVQILVAEASKLHSKSLRRLAQEISAFEGPFDKINPMIQKMIFQLMAEQKDEDDHKNWCDMELEKSVESRDDKAQKKEDLQKKMDEANAEVMELANEMETLQGEVSTLAEEIKTATADREAEKADNAITIKDAKEGQEAISGAIAVLTDFYKETGQVPKEDWELLQTGEKPETWDSSYSGLSGQPDGILKLMGKISEDFAKMEADTTAEEAENQASYDEEMTTMMITKAEKEKSNEMKTQERIRLLDKLKTWAEQHKHVAGELEAVVQYLKDLVPACGDAEEADQNKEDYEARKQARADEITALRSAQTILENAFKAKDFLQRKASIREH